MSIHFPATQFQEIVEHIATPNIRQDIDRSYELPTRLYGATIALYFAFLAVLAIGIGGGREMGLTMWVCATYVIMAFGTPAMWARMNPLTSSKAMSWPQFVENGIATFTGPMTAKDAAIQMLILPVLILLWGVGIALMVAQVS